MMISTECPFYEEHSGEYYQGCWEFNNLCWCAPILDSEVSCHSDCFVLTGDEATMISEISKSLKKARIVRGWGMPEVERPLTDREKHDIIDLLNKFIELQNDKRREINFFK